MHDDVNLMQFVIPGLTENATVFDTGIQCFPAIPAAFAE